MTSGEVPTVENAVLTEGCQGVSILGQGKIDGPLLDVWHSLGVRYLSTRTVGYDHIDLTYAKKLGIRVCSASYAPNGVADFAVMLILMCLRHYKQAIWRGQVNDFSLNGLQGREMKDLTIGVVGTGKIGALCMDTCEGDDGIVHADHRVDILPNRNWFYLHQFRNVFRNVLMTQHMAFYTDAAVASIVECGIRGIWEMANGVPCETELNR